MDAFQANPSLLQGKPKLAIGNYVERAGFQVPRRYATLEEAVSSGKPFIVRSEHPFEYDGPSGLLDSISVTEESVNRAKGYGRDFGYDVDRVSLWSVDPSRIAPLSYRPTEPWTEDVMLMQIGRVSHNDFEQQYLYWQKKLHTTETFCALTGASLDEFGRQIGISLWEKIGGYNRSIVADSSIRGRYHIISTTEDLKFHNYTIYDGGQLLVNVPNPLPPEMVSDISNVIAFYEAIRHLPAFDPNNCPIVEFQTDSEGHHFLQYHHTRAFHESTFSLDRSPRPSEVEVVLVRGATPTSAGQLFRTGLFYFGDHRSWDTGEENASFDVHHNTVFTEINVRRRDAQFIRMRSATGLASHISLHTSRSVLFKPGISAVFPTEALLTPKDVISILSEVKRKRGPVTIPIEMASDGRKAYVRLAGPVPGT